MKNAECKMSAQSALYVILSEATEGGEVEESSHYDNISRQIGAKILRLACGSLRMTNL